MVTKLLLILGTILLISSTAWGSDSLVISDTADIMDTYVSNYTTTVDDWNSGSGASVYMGRRHDGLFSEKPLTGWVRWDYADWDALGLDTSAIDSVALQVYCNTFSVSGTGLDSIIGMHVALVWWHEGIDNDACPDSVPGSVGQRRVCLDLAGDCRTCSDVDSAWNSSGCDGRNSDWRAADSSELYFSSGTAQYRFIVTPTVKYSIGYSNGDGDDNLGFVFRNSGPATSTNILNMRIQSSETGITELRPTLVIYYTAAAASTSQVIMIE